MSANPQDRRSVPDLLSDLMQETTDLLKTETSLIRSEISDKITRLETGGGSLAAGAICLLVALFVLSQALIVALGTLFGAAWAALLVGVVLAVIGALLLAKGKKDLSPERLSPDRTARQLSKDGQLLKEQTR
ncbi:phage holin family protein [Fulvimarina sp. MAC8]|uniref:phage holin family protein n=1 Tax=Fulvimarina sp. MAC8 TaxID=3162874 RepID=UPI0032EB2ADA